MNYPRATYAHQARCPETRHGQGRPAGRDGQLIRHRRSVDVRTLLRRWKRGDSRALQALVPLIHGASQRLVQSEIHGGQRPRLDQLMEHTYRDLSGGTKLEASDRPYYFAATAWAMRRVLAEHADAHNLQKSPVMAWDDTTDWRDLLALHHALELLAQVDPARARLVELRYFGGLDTREAAEVLGVSPALAERYWRTARLWLHRKLAD